MDKLKVKGVPSGIPYIISNEAAERFSYYGMKAILVIFMTDFLKMTESNATDWLHVFGSSVYAFPILGAIVSDVFWGKYKTILTLSIVYCIGHLILAFYETQDGLALGLTFIAVGSGGIKPCVSAHVGDQFNNTNKHLIERIFSYFYLSINLGAFASTLLTPILLQYYGPSIAFGIPGLLMFIATFLFWLGRKDFVHIKPFGKGFLSMLLSREGLKAIGRLSVVYLFVSVFWSLFDQTASTWVVQAKSDLIDKKLNVLGDTFDLLPSQIQAANPILVLILVPVFTFLIYPLLKKMFRLTPMRKIAIGMFIASFSFVIVAWVEGFVYQGLTQSIAWQFLAYFILTAAEVMVSITALEYSYTQAPNEMKSFIMGMFLLSVSLGNVITIGVNKWMKNTDSIESVYTGDKTFISFSEPENKRKGDKIGVEEESGLYYLDVDNKESLFVGTFVLGEFNTTQKVFEILDIHQQSIKTKKRCAEPLSRVSTYKLNGASYFYFFAGLMAFTAILFVVFLWNYEGKTYIQSEKSIL